MLLVEQVFLQTHFQSGNWIAHVTAATPSVLRADVEEITGWFSGSENRLVFRCDPFNLFFHPLPSGHHALGIIYPAQRGFLSLFQSPQVFNGRILVLSPQLLLEHGNHPIAFYEALRQRHQVPLVSQPPTHLSPLTPAASPMLTNPKLLEALVQRLGAMSLAQLTQSLFNAECTFFTSKSVSAVSVLSATFDLLPIRFRPELTFSTDFFFSQKNSFRLSGVRGHRHRAFRLIRQWGIPLIVLGQGNKGSLETLDPWARFVYQLLQTRNFNFLERYWNMEYRAAMLLPMESQPVLWSHLHETGVSLSKAMLSGALPDAYVATMDAPVHTLEELRCMAAVDQMIPMLAVPKTKDAKPKGNQPLAEQFPQFREELSELEAYLVRGIFGDESALPRMKKVWTSLTGQIDREAKEIIQEEIVATIHAVLFSLDSVGGQRLLRSSQLLDLMVFFLQTPERLT